MIALVRARISPLRAPANWCGGGAETTTNRPDTSLSSANLIHVTYAVPADGPDRFPSLAGAIKIDVDDMNPADRILELAADLATLAPPTVKSLVYYDGPVPSALHLICGTSVALAPQTGGGAPSGFTFVWLGSDCPHDLGQGGVTAVVAAHEITHDPGAVMPGAPHACPRPPGMSATPGST